MPFWFAYLLQPLQVGKVGQVSDSNGQLLTKSVHVIFMAAPLGHKT